MDIQTRALEKHNEGCGTNSPDERIDTIGCGDHVRVLLCEVSMHGRSTTMSSPEHFAAVHASRLSGGRVVVRFGEVKPNLTSGLAVSGIAVCRGGRDRGSRNDGSRVAGRYRERRITLGSDVADAVGNVRGILRHGRL
jgi:hypothetical protein